MITRRKFLASAGALAGSAAVLQKLGSAQEVKTREPNKPRETTAAANRNKPLIERVDPKPTLPPGEAGKDYTPVITPNNISLPWKVIDGVKVYHLVAEEVDHEFAPGMRAKCWGFNGHVHGPTIEAVEGDRVRIYVTNNLPEATSVHWHGILLPNGMDGVGGLTQKNIKLGDRVRIRIASVAVMDHHPIHLHGYQFRVTETDGGQIPESAQQVETTVLPAIGQSRTFDFVADQPGDWPMHCHMTH